MERRLVAADESLSRWLNWLGAEDDFRPRLVHGELWTLRDGEWTTEREMPSPHEQRRNGRAPVVIMGDAFDAVVAASDARPAQSDVKDALRGCEQVQAFDPLTGEERVDFANVPLKNADGTLNRYAKNLLEMHAPQVEASQEMAHKLAKAKAKADATNGVSE